jgi:phage terminase large subunit GpA
LRFVLRKKHDSLSLTESSVNRPGLAVSNADARAIQALAWPDAWASGLNLLVDAHPFSLVGREYQQQMLRDESKVIIAPKGAQLGWTTLFILKTLHSIIMRGWHILYLLPLKQGSVSFVQGRIDPVIDSNPQLKKEFSRTDNRAQKQSRSGVNMYIRGTNIETELREVPADILVLDERDKANEDNLDDARARLDGSGIGRVYELSTPTVDGHGVYSETGFLATDQMRWWVACPGCSSYQVLSFEENVLPYLGDTVEESVESCRCSHCQRVLTDDDRASMNATGKWVPDNPGAVKRGYHLSQLNSPTKSLADAELGFLVNWFKGQMDAKKLKAFYNLGLGLPYTAPGDKFTIELLDKCRSDYSLGGIPESTVFIGIDQGYDILYVTMWTRAKGRFRLWQVKTITTQGAKSKWVQLEEEVLSRISNWVTVCDAHPDKEDTEALSKKYPGRFWMGFEKDRPDQPDTADFIKHKHGDPAKVNIDRTMAFDSYIKAFLDGNVLLPREARDLGEHMPKLAYNAFYHQHMQMVRVEQADAQERIVARWVNSKDGSGKKPDHWHHASMFGWVAGLKDAPLVVPQDVGQVFQAAGGLVAVR